MLNLEPTSPPDGHGDDSTYSSDIDNEMDTNQEHDIVEDFARTLDRLVLQQDETNHEGSSDESDTEPFGYEQLPQEYNEEEDDDDDDVDAGYSEHQQQQEEGVNLTEGPNGYIFQAGKPEPLQLETTEDVNIPEDEAEFIKYVMSKIRLPKPEWAEIVSEEQWLPQRKK
ncbi:hypothetical protein BGW37DRAFT_484135 [Umbelopsis sp. PMI_123]|nr:hypothetical protein BGW37DRAFT_484135 [Umbelopsis sp. PMI_123]